jgi:hypothetical protein
MVMYNYAWHTPPKVNPEATHQFVRFFITTDGVTVESGYSHLWDDPLIIKQLHTGQSYTLDVQEIAGTLKSAFSPPVTGLVQDAPVWPPEPPPPAGLPNTPAAPVLAYTEVALNQL